MIAKLIKGGGSWGLCNYLLGARDHNKEERPRADIIGGTFTGLNAAQLSQEFGRLHALRPSLKNHVVHVSLRLPADERKIADEEWAAIAAHWIKGMGFEGYVAVCHGDHTHIAASRIRLDGSVVSDSNDYRRSETLVREIESRWNLRAVEASHLLEPQKVETHRKAPTMDRIAQAERGIPSAPEEVADLIEAIMATAPVTATEFVNTLEAAGIVVRPNLSTTGRLNGFSYSLDGQRVDSKSLGRGFTLSNLVKRGLEYEPSRDFTALDGARNRAQAGRIERENGGIDSASIRDSSPRAGLERSSSPGPGGPRPQPSTARAGDGEVVTGVAGDITIGHCEVTPGPSGRTGIGQDIDAGGREGGDGTSIPATPIQSAPRPDAGSNDGGAGAPVAMAAGPNRDHDKPLRAGVSGLAAGGNLGAGADADFVLSGAEDPDFLKKWSIVEAKRQASLAAASRGGRGSMVGSGPAARHLTGLAGMSFDRRHRLDLTAQLLALGGQKFILGIYPPKEFAEQLPSLGRREWSRDQILEPQRLGWLRKKNAAGYDIYIQCPPPTDKDAHPVVFVDDLNVESLVRLTQEGFEPTAVVESSPNNFQAWVKLSDQPICREIAKEAALQLAERFGGDPGSVGWVHHGRLAGFTNRKSKRTLPSGLQPFCELRIATGTIATRAEELLQRADVMVIQRAEGVAKAARRAAAQAAEQAEAQAIKVATFNDATDLDRAVAEFLKHRAAMKADDESRKDFGAAVRMLARWSPEEVAEAIKRASPNLSNRHSQVDVYVAKTIEAARRERERMRQRAQDSENQAGPGYRRR